jgi:hypothetical protein
MSGRPSAGGDSALVHELLSAARAEAVPEVSRARVAQRLGIARVAPGVDGTALERSVRPRDTSRTELGSRLRLDLGWLGVVSALLVGAPGGGATSRVAPMNAPAPALSESAARTGDAEMQETGSRQALELSPPAADAPPDVSERQQESRAAVSVAQRPSRRGASVRARARGEAPSTAASASSAPSTLLEEVRQLDRVRSSLGGSDGAGALAALERYESIFSAGELRLEARVLRVASEFAVGHTTAARRLARELLVTPGTERYRSELAQLLEEHR